MNTTTNNSTNINSEDIDKATLFATIAKDLRTSITLSLYEPTSDVCDKHEEGIEIVNLLKNIAEKDSFLQQSWSLKSNNNTAHPWTEKWRLLPIPVSLIEPIEREASAVSLCDDMKCYVYVNNEEAQLCIAFVGDVRLSQAESALPSNIAALSPLISKRLDSNTTNNSINSSNNSNKNSFNTSNSSKSSRKQPSFFSRGSTKQQENQRPPSSAANIAPILVSRDLQQHYLQLRSVIVAMFTYLQQLFTNNAASNATNVAFNRSIEQIYVTGYGFGACLAEFCALDISTTLHVLQHNTTVNTTDKAINSNKNNSANSDDLCLFDKALLPPVSLSVSCCTQISQSVLAPMLQLKTIVFAAPPVGNSSFRLFYSRFCHPQITRQATHTLLHQQQQPCSNNTTANSTKSNNFMNSTNGDTIGYFKDITTSNSNAMLREESEAWYRNQWLGTSHIDSSSTINHINTSTTATLTDGNHNSGHNNSYKKNMTVKLLRHPWQCQWQTQPTQNTQIAETQTQNLESTISNNHNNIIISSNNLSGKSVLSQGESAKSGGKAEMVRQQSEAMQVFDFNTNNNSENDNNIDSYSDNSENNVPPPEPVLFLQAVTWSLVNKGDPVQLLFDSNNNTNINATNSMNTDSNSSDNHDYEYGDCVLVPLIPPAYLNFHFSDDLNIGTSSNSNNNGQAAHHMAQSSLSSANLFDPQEMLEKTRSSLHLLNTTSAASNSSSFRNGNGSNNNSFYNNTISTTVNSSTSNNANNTNTTANILTKRQQLLRRQLYSQYHCVARCVACLEKVLSKKHYCESLVRFFRKCDRVLLPRLLATDILSVLAKNTAAAAVAVTDTDTSTSASAKNSTGNHSSSANSLSSKFFSNKFISAANSSSGKDNGTNNNGTTFSGKKSSRMVLLLEDIEDDGDDYSGNSSDRDRHSNSEYSDDENDEDHDSDADDDEESVHIVCDGHTVNTNTFTTTTSNLGSSTKHNNNHTDHTTDMSNQNVPPDHTAMLITSEEDALPANLRVSVTKPSATTQQLETHQQKMKHKKQKKHAKNNRNNNNRNNHNHKHHRHNKKHNNDNNTSGKSRKSRSHILMSSLPSFSSFSSLFSSFSSFSSSLASSFSLTSTSSSNTTSTKKNTSAKNTTYMPNHTNNTTTANTNTSNQHDDSSNDAVIFMQENDENKVYQSPVRQKPGIAHGTTTNNNNNNNSPMFTVV